MPLELVYVKNVELEIFFGAHQNKSHIYATGSPGADPGRALTHRFSGHAVAASCIQQLEGCETMTYNYLLGLWGKKGGGLAVDVSSELVFLSKKRRISMDISSGLIFLTHKKIK